MAQRKYTTIGEIAVATECTNKKCKWQGTTDQQSRNKIDEITEEHVCPNCGNNEFYGLRELPYIKRNF